MESVVVPPTAPPSVIAPVPAVSVSACVFVAVPLMVELKVMFASVVAASVFSVTDVPSVTGPVRLIGPAVAMVLVVRFPFSVIAVERTLTPPSLVVIAGSATAAPLTVLPVSAEIVSVLIGCNAPTAPVSVTVPAVPAAICSVRLFAAASASVVPEMLMFAPAAEPPPLVVSSSAFIVSCTASLMIIALPAVTMFAPSKVVAPAPSIVMDALPEPVIWPFTEIVPPTGTWMVVGSVNVIARTSTFALPLERPMVMELKPSTNAPTSPVFKLNVPVALLPMPIVVVAVTGCTKSAPVLCIATLLMVSVSALIVSAPV